MTLMRLCLRLFSHNTVSAPSNRLARVRCPTCAAGNSAPYAMKTPSATCRRRATRTTIRPANQRRSARQQPQRQQDRANQDDEREIAVQVIEPADGGERQIARDARIARGVDALPDLRAESNLQQCHADQCQDATSCTRHVAHPRHPSAPAATRGVRSHTSSSCTMTSATIRCAVTIHARQSVRDDAAAEPSFETHQQERGDGRPQDSRITAVMPPRRDRGRENQEADGDAEQTVQVLRPHQRRIEQRGIELRRQIRHRSRRDPSAKTARPVRAAEAGARRAHQAADENQEIGGGGRRECKPLERSEAHSDIMAACAASPLRRAITP